VGDLEKVSCEQKRLSKSVVKDKGSYKKWVLRIKGRQKFLVTGQGVLQKWVVSQNRTSKYLIQDHGGRSSKSLVHDKGESRKSRLRAREDVKISGSGSGDLEKVNCDKKKSSKSLIQDKGSYKKWILRKNVVKNLWPGPGGPGKSELREKSDVNISGPGPGDLQQVSCEPKKVVKISDPGPEGT